MAEAVYQELQKPPYIARGAVVVHKNVAYFMHETGEFYSYMPDNNVWRSLPRCPQEYSSLAVIEDRITAIGGMRGQQALNTLCCFTNGETTWATQQFPPMPTARHGTVAVQMNQTLIVAGGKRGQEYLNTVEVMTILPREYTWVGVASLPHSYFQASAIMCGNQIYMLGGFKGFQEPGDPGSFFHLYTKSVLTCSLPQLLNSKGDTPPDAIWNRIKDVPVFESTAVKLNEEVLVAVGGVDELRGHKPTKALYRYEQDGNQWVPIANMQVPRYKALVAVFPDRPNKIIVVGGMRQVESSSDVNIINNVQIINI